MLIAWFTAPPQSFASYYQYDPRTRFMVRIRLELGRQGEDKDNNTFASFTPDRAVAFDKERHSTNKGDWSVNADGALCRNTVPLEQTTPVVGMRTYDRNGDTGFVHRGRPVTATPSLPPEIRPEHLALIANALFRSGSQDRGANKLTGNDATPETLAREILKKVRAILAVDEPAPIEDAAVLTCLTQQATAIAGTAGDDYRALTEATSVAAYLTALRLP